MRGNGMRGGRMQAGGMQGGVAQGRGIRGCGRFGCGRDGKTCLTCRAKHGLGLGNNCGGRGCGNWSKCRDRGRPYAGEVPHMAQAPGMTGQAPQYVYPYYTTRGPRDFLQDACAPGPILPYNPKKTCLPSIGF
jgi:hypothetical protein